MRLIDADKLIELAIKDRENTNFHNDEKIKINHIMEHNRFIQTIRNQPTVYDVNKVVEQICKRCEFDCNDDCDFIKIVKAGGKE